MIRSFLPNTNAVNVLNVKLFDNTPLNNSAHKLVGLGTKPTVLLHKSNSKKAVTNNSK